MRVLEIVKVLVLAVGRVEKFKDLVALNVNGLYEYQLVVGPLTRVRMRGSIIWNGRAIAIAHLAK